MNKVLSYEFSRASNKISFFSLFYLPQLLTFSKPWGLSLSSDIMFINKFCFILHVSFSKGEGRLCLYKVEVGNEKFNLSITNLLLKLCGCSLSAMSLLRIFKFL